MLKTLRSAIFLALTIALTIGPAMESLAVTTPTVQLSQDERQMMEMLNNARITHGVKPLAIEPKLMIMARSYANEMVAYDFIDHVSPISGDLRTRIDKVNIKGWTMAGENIAASVSIEVAFDMLMNSETHRNNILRPIYTHVGVGVVDSESYGKVMVQEFMAIPKPNPKGKVTHKTKVKAVPKK